MNIPLKYIFIACIVVSVTAIIFTAILMIYSNHHAERTGTQITKNDDDRVEITRISKQSDKSYFAILKIATLIVYLVAIICMFIYAYYENRAIKYGAFGDFTQTETISSITNKTNAGFIDQSDILPDNITGCILIYYKYGCPDCMAIHDELVSTLANVNTSKVFFVSTRSEKGLQLLKKYPVDEIPSAVYISKDQTTSHGYYVSLLFDEHSTDNAQYLESNLLDLINLQTEEESQ